MKYIDAEKLIAEIDRRIKETKSTKPLFDQFWAGQISALKGVKTIITSHQQEQPAIPFMAGLKGNLPAGTKTIWCESKATPEKLVLKNELTGEVVVNKTIPEHMRRADPEITYACVTLLSAGWTLIAPGFEGVDLEKEFADWWESVHEHINIDHTMFWYMEQCALHFAEWGAKHLKK